MEDLVLRHTDLSFVFDCVREARPCAVVGLNNTGKSSLLRAVCQPAVQGRYLGPKAGNYLFVYIDCNLMLELSEQGFYEAVLRATRDVLVHDGSPEALVSQMEAFYSRIVESEHAFRVPLSFNEAIIALSEGLQKHLVLLFDEFDEPFSALNGRVFLNLRALRDRYGTRLCYVTATERPLHTMRDEADVSEFSELFAGRTHWLQMLGEEDAVELLKAHAAPKGVALEPEMLDFARQQAGGHPGLLQATAQVMLRIAAGAPDNLRKRGLNLTRDVLDSDPTVRTECAKLWQQLEEDEQEALLRLVTLGVQQADEEQLASLQRKGILVGPPSRPVVFGQLFTRFVRRQHLIREQVRRGVLVDVDAGEVWVDGVPVPTLTELEYRLLLLLYGRINKICDKYQIVEAVWGESYIDQVDDARVEKLVSRLRTKLERDPSNPQYLITIRGRGYKLVGV